MGKQLKSQKLYLILHNKCKCISSFHRMSIRVKFLNVNTWGRKDGVGVTLNLTDYIAQVQTCAETPISVRAVQREFSGRQAGLPNKSCMT